MVVGAVFLGIGGYVVLVYTADWLWLRIAGENAGKPGSPWVPGFLGGVLLVIAWLGFVDY